MKKHPSVEIWKQFRDDNPDTFGPDILTKADYTHYLENRLHKAFMAGYAGGAKAEKDRIKEKLAKLTD